MPRVAPGEFEIAHGLGVHRKERHGGAELGRHVGDRRTLGKRERIDTVTKELDDLRDHVVPAKNLRYREHEIRRGHPRLQAPLEPAPDHLGDEHGDGLAERHRPPLQAAHAPTDDAECIDHGRVAVHRDDGIRIGEPPPSHLLDPDHAGQELQVDLVQDAGTRREDAHVAKRFAAPAQKFVALAVLCHLERHVVGQRARAAMRIHHDRMIDDEIDGDHRIDLAWITAQRLHRIAHCCHVPQQGDARGFRHHHARRTKTDFAVGRVLPVIGQPAGKRSQVVRRRLAGRMLAQQVLQYHLDAMGQA